jgi:hypothetical protein
MDLPIAGEQDISVERVVESDHQVENAVQVMTDISKLGMRGKRFLDMIFSWEYPFWA